MVGELPKDSQKQFLYNGLSETLNPGNPLYKLASRITWPEFEEDFTKHYSPGTGRPSIPIRVMVSLLILKQMFNSSDEEVVERWVENPYWQYFSGMEEFQWDFPIDPTDLVYFRKRIGEKGAQKILSVSINLFGKKSQEKEVVVDTTVQEKNITFPTDSKLYRKVISRCVSIAKSEDIKLRQSYRRVVKRLLLAQRFRNHPKNYRKALQATRKLKTIAGRLTREIERKLTKSRLEYYKEKLIIFNRILTQQRDDKNKIYSIHEPDVKCISKGKEHKRYEFGAKGSIAVTKTDGIIVGALSFKENVYDGHTLPSVLSQIEEMTGKRPEIAITDRGYRGRSAIGVTQILIPKPPKKTDTAYEKRKARARFRRRAGIEPRIGHLKSDFRLGRNFLKGCVGDSINLMLSAAAHNFRKLLRGLLDFLRLFFMDIYMLPKPAIGQ